ncbi:MAG: hypothetical protein JXA91_08600 [Candidatus Thermoplasmatota archaeon]|nr:hypothetical protein [Candidatus Thermoplasmatota archaeon]
MHDNEVEKELVSLRNLICGRDFGGMTDFSEERSHILKLTYACLRNTKKSFGECQKESWQKYRAAVKDCMR